MPYLPTSLPFPSPSRDTSEFWQYCAERCLKFQACGECGIPRHPPTPMCPHCRSQFISWIDAPSFGRIFSYTVVFSASHDAVINDLPYNVVLVEFDGMDDLRLVSNVVDAKPDELAIGREVVVVWEMGPNGQLLPRFKLRKTK